MIPAISILVNFKHEPLWFTPWICESLGIFLMAVSDSWFALVVLTSLLEQYWLSALFFAAHYLVIAAGLIWYIKFLLAVPADTNSRRLSTEVTISTDNIPKSIFSSNNKRRLLPFYRKEKRVRYITIAALATIIIITTAGIVNYYYYSSSSYLPYPLLSSFLSFANNNNANSEIILPAPVGSKNIVTLGALLPLTGTLSSVGESEEAALDIAVKDINQNFSKNHSSIQISVVVEDTQTNPSVSLEKLKYLVGKGIRIIIGPATSADLQATQDYANSNGVLLLSPSSTAPSLAIAGNNVFRFIPDDTHQAQAISKLMWNDGIRVVIPFWRTDVYGNDLVNAVKQNFQQLGGRVLQGVGYTPNTGDFFASLNRINFIVWDQDLRSLSSKLNQAISTYGVDKVAVYLVSFDEVAPIFIQAQSHPILSTVKWYGSDGSALNNKLIRNPEAAAFAVKTSFPTPIYAVENDSNDKFKHFEAEIHKKIERTPRSYASVAYDVLWIAALTENSVKNVHDTNNYLRNTLVKIANSYNGITGNTSLNQAGDRKYGDYDFWAIRNADNTYGTFAWKVVSKYLLEETKNKQRLMPEIISTR
jgi:branched-chain amino acid transport system substrate-binding protein